MQFIDLAAQQKKIRKDLERRILAVLDHGRYVMGEEITELEGLLADYCGARHALACSSGTDALVLALMALGAGPGDAVFTTPFTFVATAEAIALVGATPVFVDIDPQTYNLDPQALDRAVKALKAGDAGSHPLPAGAVQGLTPRGIIPVDLFGLPADYDAIGKLAKKHGLWVVEDAAQSFGGVYKGRKACSLARIGCTSFFPAKPLGGYGDGGMCFTDDPDLHAAMVSLRVHGQGTDKYENVRIGMNGRLDTLQAAVLLAKFTLFPQEVDLRQKVAARYTRHLAAHGTFVTPHIPKGCQSAWAQYSLLTQARDRDRLLAHLKDQGVPTAVYYPLPLHLQKAFAPLGYKPGDFPVSENCAGRIFSLPMHPYLSAGDQEAVVGALLEFGGK
ncbi:MAG: DegT/DnrJ/EryC1/StrS family aminotransferase [Proteobacteria bacterium]|nr:DegT/DnrJ/EryC1/StrS family aminotransferase [Pseudomonadota bacterium]